MNDAYESIFFAQFTMWTLQSGLLGGSTGEEPKESDEKPNNNTHFEKQNSQIAPLDV
jgi:hypothetical protein